ncbi:MFS transporter [Rhodohalobacter sp. SW132]|uniref:MFS transporter n=1 Tax=Rhodohalobacter sp. SW132 TaxID=2293433 RepID=UPI000E25A6CB|nr:MFS transporter [Rhodohalobacter sp. SW132]REL25080.1 MFS transporter [Rhodohalobacter sp. SW132]
MKRHRDDIPRASKKEIFGWAMFDFANQAYTLLIITVIFPVLFTTVIVGDSGDDYRLGNLLWSIALGVSYFMVVLSGPVFGAIMDYSAMKKRFLFFSYIATIFATSLLYFVEPGMIVVGVILIILSNFAYATGESFIAAFLPSLGPPNDLGKISGFGWALGYIGGLVSAGFVIVYLGDATAENFDRIRWVGPFAALFFMLAAIPTFIWLKEPGKRRELPEGETFISVGFARLGRTINEVKQFWDLAVFLISVFFAMAGIYIVISFAFIYGDQVVQWDEEVRVLMFVVVQITAAAGAFSFGMIQDKIGSKLTYNLTLLLWFFAVLGIWGVTDITDWFNAVFDTSIDAQYMFLYIGVLAGLSLGSSQSASRALVGLFSPEHKSAEFFGFWGLSNKLAGVFGIIGLGLLQAQFGLQMSVLFCAALFLVGIVVSLFVNEARGRQVADSHENEEV